MSAASNMTFIPSNDFFKTFIDVLLLHLHNTLLHAFTKRSFPKEMLSAIIITLPKPGKTTDVPQNLRPYQNYANALALCLSLPLPSTDQVGFLKGHQATVNTRRVLYMEDFIECTGTGAIMGTLDSEKVFDHINWLFNFSVLHKMGIHWEILRKALISKPDIHPPWKNFLPME